MNACRRLDCLSWITDHWNSVSTNFQRISIFFSSISDAVIELTSRVDTKKLGPPVSNEQWNARERDDWFSCSSKGTDRWELQPSSNNKTSSNDLCTLKVEGLYLRRNSFRPDPAPARRQHQPLHHQHKMKSKNIIPFSCYFMLKKKEQHFTFTM